MPAALASSTEIRVSFTMRASNFHEEGAQDIGPMNVAVYNAGAQHRKPLLEITGDQFEKVWRLGCYGAFVFGREAIRHMVPN